MWYNLDMENLNTIALDISNFIRSTKEAFENLEKAPNLSASVLEAVKTVVSCKGKIITAGLGKAGYAAEKSASSFSSLGIPSCYLHPAQASHGDVGIIQNGDVLIAFSTSGKTREVIETIELARKLGIGKVIAITSHETSPVKDLSDISVDMGIIKEAGYLSMAPTTSIVIMLTVSDMIATISAKQNGLTLNDFGLRHHGGYLGKKCRGEEA
jgi:arabinose-5-phosphate isomerase